MIECQTHIYERFLKGIMVLKAKPSKVKAKKEEDAEVKKEDGKKYLVWLLCSSVGIILVRCLIFYG